LHGEHDIPHFAGKSKSEKRNGFAGEILIRLEASVEQWLWSLEFHVGAAPRPSKGGTPHEIEPAIECGI
jgi:hypothetical protein